MKFLCYLFCFVSLCFSEVTYPFSSWGQIGFSKGSLENDFIGSAYFEQGVDFVKYKSFAANMFIGIRPSIASNTDYYWENKSGPWFGFKLKESFSLFDKFWGSIDLGVRYEYYKYYFANNYDASGFNYFINLGFGGNWKKFDRRFIVSFPLSSWASIYSATGDLKESNIVCSGYIEQGVNILKIRENFLNTFIGYRFNHSDNYDFWNNKVGLIIGVKFIDFFNMFNKGDGQLNLGIQREFYTYTKTDRHDSQVLLFLQWGFNGDWSK